MSDNMHEMYDDETVLGRPSSVDVTPDSLLSELVNEAQRELVPADATVETPGRPGWFLVFSTDISAAQVENLRKRSRRGRSGDDIDGVKFGMLLIRDFSKSIRKGGSDGDDVVKDGVVLNFRTPEFHSILGTLDAISAISKWFGSDPDIMRVAGEVLTAAGFGDEATEYLGVDSDPTRP